MLQKNNTTMESVSIPEGVTEIGFAAFSGCYNLKSVQLPKSLIKIGASAFFWLCCVAKKVEFPENSGLELSNSAFASTGLRELDLPENVKLEDDCVFANCEKLTQARVEIKGRDPTAYICELYFFENGIFWEKRSRRLVILHLSAALHYQKSTMRATTKKFRKR